MLPHVVPCARCRVDFGGECEALVDRLIELRMLIEATLDFPEEEIDSLE